MTEFEKAVIQQLTRMADSLGRLEENVARLAASVDASAASSFLGELVGGIGKSLLKQGPGEKHAEGGARPASGPFGGFPSLTPSLAFFEFAGHAPPSAPAPPQPLECVNPAHADEVTGERKCPPGGRDCIKIPRVEPEKP